MKNFNDKKLLRVAYFKDIADLVTTILIISGLGVVAILAIGGVTIAAKDNARKSAECIANYSTFNETIDISDDCKGQRGDTEDTENNENGENTENGEDTEDELSWILVADFDDSGMPHYIEGKIYHFYPNGDASYFDTIEELSYEEKVVTYLEENKKYNKKHNNDDYSFNADFEYFEEALDFRMGSFDEYAHSVGLSDEEKLALMNWDNSEGLFTEEEFEEHIINSEDFMLLKNEELINTIGTEEYYKKATEIKAVKFIEGQYKYEEDYYDYIVPLVIDHIMKQHGLTEEETELFLYSPSQYRNITSEEEYDELVSSVDSFIEQKNNELVNKIRYGDMALQMDKLKYECSNVIKGNFKEYPFYDETDVFLPNYQPKESYNGHSLYYSCDTTFYDMVT